MSQLGRKSVKKLELVYCEKQYLTTKFRISVANLGRTHHKNEKNI